MKLTLSFQTLSRKAKTLAKRITFLSPAIITGLKNSIYFFKAYPVGGAKWRGNNEAAITMMKCQATIKF